MAGSTIVSDRGWDLKGTAGYFVVLIGPDGVGKTSVARELAKQFSGEFRYFHFRPSWRLQSMPLVDSGQRVTAFRPPGKFSGWIRLSSNLIRFWIGYLVSLRPVRRRGGLIVGDRWAYSYLLDPASVRYGGPMWLATLMLRLLPRPDLVCALTASPQVIHTRKPELSIGEITRQLAEIARLPSVVTLEATDDPGVVAARVLELCHRDSQ